MTAARRVLHAIGARLTPFFAAIGVRALALAFPWSIFSAPSPQHLGRRILFIRAGGVGDSLVALPALRALSARFPGSTVDIVGAAELKDACQGLDFIGEIIPVTRSKGLGFFRAARHIACRPPYDIVIDGFTYRGRIGLSTSLILAASRAPIRLGRSLRDVGTALTHLAPPRAPDLHYVDEMFDAVAVLGSPSPRDRRLELALTPGEILDAASKWESLASSGPRVLINISAGHRSREWEWHRYREVAQDVRLRRPDARILILGHGRRDAAVAIAESCDGLAPKTTFREMMALVGTADLIITPDTSIAHIAASLDRTTVSLHQADNHRWAPYNARGRQLFSSSFVTINFIPASDVKAAVAELFATEPRLQ